MHMRRIASSALALMLGACGSSNKSGSTADDGGSSTTTTAATVAVKVVKGSGTLTAADGGFLLSDDGLFALYVPPQALAKDTAFKVSPVASADLAGPLAGAEIRGAVHGVEPTGLKFAKPALVLRSVDTQAAGLSQTAAPVVDLVSASGDKFDVLGNQVVVDYGSQVLVAGTTTHLTQFIVLGDKNTMIDTTKLEQIPAARDLSSLIALTPGVQVQTTDAPLRGATLQNTVTDILPPDAFHDRSLPTVDMLDLRTILRANRFDQARVDTLYGFYTGGAVNALTRTKLGSADLVNVSDLGGPSYCDRTNFTGKQGMALFPMVFTPRSTALMQPIGLAPPADIDHAPDLVRLPHIHAVDAPGFGRSHADQRAGVRHSHGAGRLPEPHQDHEPVLEHARFARADIVERSKRWSARCRAVDGSLRRDERGHPRVRQVRRGRSGRERNQRRNGRPDRGVQRRARVDAGRFDRRRARQHPGRRVQLSL